MQSYHRGSLVPVFDIGRVLVRWEPDLALARHLPNAESVAAFKSEIGFDAWHQEQDRGRTVEEAVEAIEDSHPHYAAAARGFYDDWLASLPAPIPGTHTILEGLSRRGPVYGISNFNRALFDRTVPHFPFLGLFSGLVISSDEGLVKPDPTIYRVFAERYSLNPADCVFIDDSAANVAAAEEFGMTALLFTDAISLASRLSSLGFRWD
jgi:2-haloacid dehalogenase